MKRDKFFILFNLDGKSYSSKGLLLIVYLYFGALVFASLLAPLMFRLVHFLDPETQSYLANKPFSDFFDRSRLLCLLILFPVLMKRANLFSWKRLGYLPAGSTSFFRWFVIGMGMMAIIYAINLSLGILVPNDDWSWGNQLEKVATGMVGALLIGLLEESFFRGFVFRTFYTSIRPQFAVIASSLFFAYLHFKMPEVVLEHVPPQEIGLAESWIAVWGTLTVFSSGINPVLFVNLFLVGILLDLAFLYTRNLWTCVGIHAGWVVVIQSFGKTFNEADGAHPFFGTERVADGSLVTLFLVGFVALFIWLMRKRSSVDR